MEKVICNDKENKVVKEESEENCGLIFPFYDSGELSIPILFQGRWYKLQVAATKIFLTLVRI